MATQAELDEFDKLFAADVQDITSSMSGSYAQEMQELLHLSGQVETQGTIAVTPTDTYAQLIALVQRASSVNLSQAELRDRITALGTTAVEISKKVAGLATLFG